MSVWFCIPSCRPPAEAKDCLDRWRKMGYKIALLRQGESVECDLEIPTGEYLGWARSTNILAREVLRRDASCNWVVAGGDDYWPEMNFEALQIEAQCNFRFARADRESETRMYTYLGVMQPTGDRWGDNPSSRATFGENRGAEIDRVAGSPWMGREWCERAYLGNGPMWDGYHHIYADEELQEVAIKLGVFWQRPDLTQFHNHPSRTDPKGYQVYQEGHLAGLYTPQAFNEGKKLLDERRFKGFPGSELCPR